MIGLAPEAHESGEFDSPSMTLDIALPDGTHEALCLAGHGPLRIGRDDDCHVVLDAPTVSRVHISLEITDEGLVLRDHSSNGTLVGQRVLRRERLVIAFGAHVEVGPYRVSVRAPVPRPKPVARETVRPQASHSANAPAPSSHDTVSVELRRKIHRTLLDQLDLASMDRSMMQQVVMRPTVMAGLRRIASDLRNELPSGDALEALLIELCDEALGLGPLEQLLADNSISEIMVVDPHNIYVESKGRMRLTNLRFTDDEAVRSAIERIVTPLGRRIDESTPLVDARLADGSRVNAIIPPLALRGPCITIRKFSKSVLTVNTLIDYGSLTKQMATFLERCVKTRKNVVISGGTGSGKTTLLNILSMCIPDGERIVTIEDAAELQLQQPHVVPLEARPANMEGKGEYSIRDLVKNALRMRPDRIVVGECRGGEAIDMLQAMNTGHEGSMTTTHANNPREALARLETLCLMAGLDVPARAIRAQIASSLHVVVQQSRFADGSRRVTSIAEVLDVGDNGEIRVNEIFTFQRTGTGADGKVEGEYRMTGYLPTFLHEFVSSNALGNEALL